MRIAFITHYTALYGANKSLLNLIDGLKRYNVEPYVVVPGTEDILCKKDSTDILKELDKRGIPVAILPMEWWVASKNFEYGIKKVYQRIKWRYYTFQRLKRNFQVLPKLIQQLDSWNIEIVYSNSSVIPVGALAAWKMKLPHVWHLREFIDLDYNFNFDWGKKVSSYFISLSNAQIVVSKAIQAHFFDDALSKNVHVVYNGVLSTSDFDKLYKEVQQKKQKDNIFTFLIIGVIHPNKGQDVAIKAFAKVVEHYPEVRLLIVGMGNISSLKTLAKDLNIADKVYFWGHIANPYKAYLESDAVLMCSTNEAMGRVTVEAMSACCPVIGYDNAGTSELIVHDEIGLLYEGGYSSLAKAMIRLVDNPDWSRELGIAAWQFSRSRYSVESYSEAIYAVLTNLQSKLN